MDSTKIYNSLCFNAKMRVQPKEYVEWHHVLPRSMGGSDAKENLVALTAREHFVAHILLVKMSTGINRFKMIRALVRMCESGNNSGRYALARKIIADNSRGENNPAFGCSWWHNPHTKETFFLKPEESRVGLLVGLPFQRGGFVKGRFWINNGIDNRMVETGTLVPAGWIKGRTWKPTKDSLKKAAAARHTIDKDNEHSKKLSGRISICLGGACKKIKPDELAEYVEQGWVARGANMKTNRPIVIDGVLYASVTQAARLLEMNVGTIIGRLASPYRNSWSYV